MSKLLDLYTNWQRPGKAGQVESISSPGKYINGRENNADGRLATDFFKVQATLGAEIEGFKTKRQKGDPTEYPVADDKAMQKAREQETGGTYDTKLYDWNNNYTKSFIRE
jgi:hypothetical protein